MQQNINNRFREEEREREGERGTERERGERKNGGEERESLTVRKKWTWSVLNWQEMAGH